MMRILLIFAIALPALCGRKVERARQEQELYRAPIDSMRIAENANGKVVVEIFGQLPSPAYELHHIQVVRKGNRVILTPWLSYERERIVIMMTVPLHRMITLPVQKRRKITVQVQGANKTLIRDIIQEP